MNRAKKENRRTAKSLDGILSAISDDILGRNPDGILLDCTPFPEGFVPDLFRGLLSLSLMADASKTDHFSCRLFSLIESDGEVAFIRFAPLLLLGDPFLSRKEILRNFPKIRKIRRRIWTIPSIVDPEDEARLDRLERRMMLERDNPERG